MENKTGTIKQKIMIDATTEEVYRAYMDSRIHSKFTGSKAKIVPREGGKMAAWDNYITGKNLELVKNKRIVQEWSTSEWPDGYPPSIVTITLRRVGRRTELTMVQSKVPKSQIKDYTEGWKDWYWKPLMEYFKAR
ncbi:MAG: SRPBCC domain-containing protein [Candidatus Micrarchaeota archaeon]|nr:SRPBCC domain-containing protein [Candidatus Micrarchaeota archaeon]